MITAILLSGGVGSRMGLSMPKQYLPLAGKPLALHCYKLLKFCPLIAEVIVVCEPSYQSLFYGARFALPGQRRQDSLYNGLLEVSQDTNFILVHDAARPLLNEDDLEKIIETGQKVGAATLATPVKVTIKQADENLMVIQTFDRSSLYDIQTPQVINKNLLLKGFEKAIENDLTVPDDVSLVELISHPVQLVMGSYENIKVTTPEDLPLAENIIRERTSLL